MHFCILCFWTKCFLWFLIGLRHQAFVLECKWEEVEALLVILWEPIKFWVEFREEVMKFMAFIFFIIMELLVILGELLELLESSLLLGKFLVEYFKRELVQYFHLEEEKLFRHFNFNSYSHSNFISYFHSHSYSYSHSHYCLDLTQLSMDNLPDSFHQLYYHSLQSREPSSLRFIRKLLQAHFLHYYDWPVLIGSLNSNFLNWPFHLQSSGVLLPVFSLSLRHSCRLLVHSQHLSKAFRLRLDFIDETLMCFIVLDSFPDCLGCWLVLWCLLWSYWVCWYCFINDNKK